MTKKETKSILEFLRSVELFAGLSEPDLKMLCDKIHERSYKAGDIIFNQGDYSQEAYIIKLGKLEILNETKGKQVLLAVRDVGDFIGEISLFQDTPRTATIKARGDVSLICIGKDVLDELMGLSVTASKTMLNTILKRWNSTETLLKQNDKMIQLGTLSAGLAHELNNPSSAIARSSAELHQLLDDLLELQFKIDELDLTLSYIEFFRELKDRAKSTASKPVIMDAMTRSDLESEMEELLESYSVENPWDFTSSLIDMKYSLDEVKGLSDKFKDEEFEIIIWWMTKSYKVFNLLEEIRHSGERVSAIVSALKEYSYLDQAPLQNIDVHKGINNTILILQNKLKYGITVKLDYGEDVPKIQAFGSELNQVWTNLLDNAADALSDLAKDNNGVITIRTSLHDDWLLVEFEDNGPGIPPDIKDKIFNPFFTTKAPGKGTGLGLDISYNIVAEKHNGDIKVYSYPGKTIFRVFIPISLDISTSPITDFVIPEDEQLLNIIKNTNNIAILGITNAENNVSNSVPRYLMSKGFNIFGINPKLSDFNGGQIYSSMTEIKDPIDLVLVFDEQLLKASFENILNHGVKTLWMHEGIINESIAMWAIDNNMNIVMDRCFRASHKRLV